MYDTSKAFNYIDRNNLKDRVCLLGYGGSIAYGTNLPTSDIDVRGIYTNSLEHLLTKNKDKEVYEDSQSDTTLYSLDKVMSLLSGCNPNVIEILGLIPEHYLIIDKFGKMLLDNRQIFLSKRAYYTFVNYAEDNLRRLEGHLLSGGINSKENEQKVLEIALNRRVESLKEKFKPLDIKCYYDNNDSDLKVDVDIKGVKGSEASQIFNEITGVISGYKSLGQRNTKATNEKLCKHIMHLFRLLYMCIDILKYGEINTYRVKEHELLMNIRNGMFLNADGTLKEEFHIMFEALKREAYDAFISSKLPKVCNINAVNRLMYEINLEVIRR